MCTLPIGVTMTAGLRAGAPWVGLVGFTAGLFAWLDATGQTPPSILGPEATAALVAATQPMLAGSIFGYAALYESTRDRMRASLDSANAEVRRVLDNVGQGFFVAGEDGRVLGAPSAAATAWFGPRSPDEPASAWLTRGTSTSAEWFQMAWAEVFEGVLPLALSLAQLPDRLERDGQVLRLAYKPLPDSGVPTSLIVIISEVTAEVAAARAEQVQREQAALLVRLSSDRRGFMLFWDEARAILNALRHGASPASMRQIHTLKGNAALFGLQSVASACHAIESRVADGGGEPSAHDVAGLVAAWTTATGPIGAVLAAERARVEIDVGAYAALGVAIDRGVDHARLAAMLESWRHEPTAASLARVAEQAHALAARLGKADLVVTIDDGGLRLDPARWGGVWSALVHAVRNAVDHGVESPEYRLALGKPAAGQLRQRARQEGADAVIEVLDDGAGVDWDRVAVKAAAAGLPHATPADLMRTLFSDGLSTRDEVTELSGRGVGLAALAEQAAALGGRVEIESERGLGTTLRVRAPAVGDVVSA